MPLIQAVPEFIQEGIHTKNSQGSPQIHRRWWRCLLNRELQGIPNIFNNIRTWRFRGRTEVCKIRRMLLKRLGTTSQHVECRIILLDLSKSAGKHNGHEWVLVIAQDAYISVTCNNHQETYQRSHVTLNTHATYPLRGFTRLSISLFVFL